MGKKDKVSVGRTIIKAKGKRNKQGKGKESWLHTSELNDGDDWNRLPMQSVTEESALDEFLATAQLAGTEFIAEKLNISVVPSYNNKGGLPSVTEEQRIRQVQDDNKQFLQIPRRPSWDGSTTAEQLDQYERESFLNWRRSLAELQEKDDIIMTPFERNLQFWRQLWRVIERSDVIVQIVDARNPLLFRCEDLESYVEEVSRYKTNVILVNKADLLTQEQRETWAKYFQNINIKAVFWSAVIETENQLDDIEEGVNTEEMEPETTSSELQENVLSEEHVTKFLDLDEDMNGDKNDEMIQMNLEKDLDVEKNDEKDDMDIDLNTVTGKHEYLDDPNDQKGSLLSEEQTSVTVVDSSPNDGDSSVDDGTRNIDDGTRNIDDGTQNIDDGTQNIDGTTQNSPKQIEASSSCEETLSNYQGSSCVEETSCLSSKDIDNDESCSSVVLPSEGEVTSIGGKAIEFYTSGNLLNGHELLDYFRWLHQENGEIKNPEDNGSINTVIGLVGYPNVGKSSTINAILQAKKVPVSATPGRTKHFQTLFVDENVCLCDCPGLVFPSFVSTKAEMVVNGILPIDQMRDHIAPVSLICRRIPRPILETVYGINLVAPQEGEDPDRDPYAEELLNAYGYSKGYMTSKGRPDGPRSSRYILKDYVNGKLLYCHPPPSHNLTVFQVSFTGDTKTVKKKIATGIAKTTNKTNSLDKDFFKQNDPKSFVSATTGTEEYRRQMTAALQEAEPGSRVILPGKPWKKHGNRNKKEKIRRLQDKTY